MFNICCLHAFSLRSCPFTFFASFSPKYILVSSLDLHLLLCMKDIHLLFAICIAVLLRLLFAFELSMQISETEKLFMQLTVLIVSITFSSSTFVVNRNSPPTFSTLCNDRRMCFCFSQRVKPCFRKM